VYKGFEMSNADLRSGAAAENVGVSPDDFRAVCGLFPTGVTVVTRNLSDGRPYGMTVSSFTSVSLFPPMILVCIDRSAGFLEDLSTGLPFIVNVLSENQQNLAERFSSRREDDRFAGLDWLASWSNVPLLTGIAASFGCSLSRVVEGGDHLILLGSVQQVLRHGDRSLVWCESKYHCLPAVGTGEDDWRLFIIKNLVASSWSAFGDQ